MSLSNPTNNTINPAKIWLEWKGADGGLRYYDKEKESNVDFQTPTTFILLDTLYTIKGWHDASESGIYSNEVHRTRDEPFTVKAFKGGVLAEGYYANIKDKVKSSGGRFVANNYVAIKIDGSLEIASLQFKGAALSEWMEFTRKNKIYGYAVKIDMGEERKKGSTSFVVPSFSLKDISEETLSQSIKLDEQLQEYLGAYKQKPDNEEEPNTPEHLVEEQTDELPF